MITVKAAGDWELDVLGVPFGGPGDRDSYGEYFSPETRLHDDKFPLPPIVYYHGYDPKTKKPTGQPEYIGKAISREARADGVWYRVVLDKASQLARRVWQAAKEGLAVASSGSVQHLARIGQDGRILEWPVAELSIWDNDGTRPQANRHAVALPVLKMMYQQAGIDLPVDIEPEPEAEAEGPGGQSAKAGKATDMDESSMKGQIAMSDEIKAAVAEALKAEREATKAAADAARAQQEAIDAAVKAEKEKWEKEAAKANRLPGGGEAPYVAKFGNISKFDNLDPVDNAALIDILSAARSKGHSRSGVSIDAYRALAVKLGASKEDNLRGARQAMKMAGVPDEAIKANEMNQSTLASYGDEWVGVTYSNNLWERITQDAQIVGRVPVVEVPQGSESVIIPLAGTPPSFYVTAQASAQGANPGAITNTVVTSKMGTGQATLSVKKLSGADIFTGELEEDSLIPWIPELRRNMQQEAGEVLEHIMIDGDTATGATTNINDIGGTPAGTEAFLAFNGFRKSCLVTTTANSRDGGVLAITDFLETLKLMGLAGRNALDQSRVGFIVDLWTHWKALELAQVATRDVYSAPTIENGMLTNIYGHDVTRTANMHRANQDATYGLKANSAGKIDLDTASNNTTGSILAVRWDQWRLGYKRRWTFETERHALADATVIVASSRVGMVQRDTEASAISYNLTV